MQHSSHLMNGIESHEISQPKEATTRSIVPFFFAIVVIDSRTESLRRRIAQKKQQVIVRLIWQQKRDDLDHKERKAASPEVLSTRGVCQNLGNFGGLARPY